MVLFWPILTPKYEVPKLRQYGIFNDFHFILYEVSIYISLYFFISKLNECLEPPYSDIV
jgi:hypothetical protein